MDRPLFILGKVRMPPRAAGILVLVLILAGCSNFPANVSVVETTASSIGPGPGFGDRQNSYSWSMAYFNHKLYVGTVRNMACVEHATADFFFPGQNSYTTNPAPGTTCPANKYDLNLQAEIWQYDETNAQWTRVYQSPADIDNPRAPGKPIAEDIGFRNMVVYGGALYVFGVTADEYIPELAAKYPPRILRSIDGVHFTPIVGSPPTVQYDLNDGKGVKSYPVIGYRAAVIYHNRLFVTASVSLTGDGPVMEIGNPAGATPIYTQVSPPSMNAYEMEVFGKYLYVGTGTASTGYGVYKTDAGGPRPYSFTAVVTGGAGRGPYVTSVVSMHQFADRLYVGSSGWYNSTFPASELIRISSDDSWQLVVGNPRTATVAGASTFLWPISGLPDGFGNAFNAHFWRMQTWQNGLLLGTNDWSYFFQGVPGLDSVTRPQWGFDVYGSCDGQNWYTATPDAFGDGQYNFGARTMETSGDSPSVYVGSANHAQGTNVWRLSNTTPGTSLCPAPTAPAAAAHSIRVRTVSGQSTRSSSPRRDTKSPHLSTRDSGFSGGTVSAPGQVEADAQACGSVVSWDPAQGATGYRVLRSEFRLQNVTVFRGPSVRSGSVPDAPGTGGPGSVQVSGMVPIQGAPQEVGRTSQTYFVDSTAKAGTRYLYTVQTVTADGALSAASNVALSPSAGAPVSFASVVHDIFDKVLSGKVPDMGVRLIALVTKARLAAEKGDLTSAVAALKEFKTANPNLDKITAEDLGLNISKLARQLSLARIACDRGASLGIPGGTSSSKP